MKRHPQLGVVPVKHPSSKKKSHHITWEGRLRTIDVSEYVEWRDSITYDSTHGLGPIFEELHNKYWWSIHDTNKPHWRLIVLGGRHAIFCCDHFIGDGLSGYAFQRSLLKALNNLDPASDTSTTTNDWTVQVPKSDPIPYWPAHFPLKISLLTIIWQFIVIHITRLLYPPRKWLFADSILDPEGIKTLIPLGSRRPKTRVVSVRITDAQQNKLLTMCREHGASLTSLVYTVILVTLAADVYPDATIGITGCPFSLRSFTEPKRSTDDMYNMVGSFMPVEKLGAYRAAGRRTSDEQSAGVDKQKVWALAVDYKRRLQHDLTKSHKSVQASLGMNLMGETNEDFFKNGFPNLWLFQRGGFKISNLGLFRPEGEREMETGDGEWRIENVEFSQSAEKSNMGSAGVTVNMAGVKGAGSWLHMTFEEGCVKAETVEKMAEGVRARIEKLTVL